MVVDNEKLMQKFVRTGMIMRFIDGEGPCGHGKRHGGHGHKHGEGHGGRCHGGPEGHEMREHGHGPEAGEEGQGGKCCHGHGPGHGHGHGHGPGHGHGRRRGQARVLTMVAMQEGINQKDLAFLLGIRPQTIGEMLRKLEERGFVERRKSEEDARATQVFLTDGGRVKAAEIAERRALAAADMFAVLTDEEKDQLDALLDKLGAEMDKYRPACPHKRGEAEAEDEPED